MLYRGIIVAVVSPLGRKKEWKDRVGERGQEVPGVSPTWSLGLETLGRSGRDELTVQTGVQL